MIPRVVGRLVRREQAVEGMWELGPGAEIVVQAGQVVTPDTLIGSTKTGSRVVRLPLNEGEVASTVVLKRAGETVRRGEPLLRRASFFGLTNTEFLCPVDGYVEEILVPQRAVLIRELTADVRAGVPGTVKSVVPDRGVVLSFDGTIIRCFAGWGPPVAGPLTEACELFAPADVSRYLNETHRGKVIWASSTLCAEAILEAARIEAAGILAGSVSLAELQRAAAELRQRSGRDGLPLTLVITESFGSDPMSEEFSRYLRTAVGQAVYLDPAVTSELAWAREPEVAFSPDAGSGELGTAAHSPAGQPEAYPPAGQPEAYKPTSGVSRLVEGARVRVLDLDHFGKRGKVHAAPQLTTLETTVVVESAHVLLDGGAEAIIPVQNLEVIESASAKSRQSN